MNPEELVKEFLKYIGEDPEREGLKDTPRRVVNMWKELFRGYDPSQKPKITTFNNGADGITYDQMIVDSGNFYSHCEHHVIPFMGKYIFAYIPDPKGKILGLSKVARTVDYYSAKLQIQERLVQDIVEELWNALSQDTEYPPQGMALAMKAEHLCKTMRGAKKKGYMITTHLKGIYNTDKSAKAEFIELVNKEL